MATAAWQPIVDGLVSDLRKVFAERLQSVVVYGPHAEGAADSEPILCLALVASLNGADLDACARYAPRWKRQGLAIPLLLRGDEFRRSLDAFPLEYAEIMRAHRRVYGEEPFAGVSIAAEDLRRACETHAKSLLVHLREGFLEAGGRPTEVARLVTASAPAFAALLRNVARLHDVNVQDRSAATREGARLAGLPDAIVADVLMLELPRGVSAADPARLFPGYLATVEQLAGFVDAWRGPQATTT
jgi:hypothetical protein